MRKKKELPRKRKRFIKRLILLCIFLFFVVIIVSGAAYYIYAFKLQKPLFISPLPTTQLTQINQEDIIYYELQKDLKNEHVQFTAILHSKDFYVVTLQDGGKVTFSQQKDIMTQIASLQYILSHLTMEGRQFSTLDLRFDKPVVVLKP